MIINNNNKNVSPLAEPPGLCNILLLEVFESFLTSDECELHLPQCNPIPSSLL